MKFSIDHDLHIHTFLSNCSGDPNQTPANILNYAKRNGLKTVCITDHYWDSAVPLDIPWYANQDFKHVSQSLPLPQDKDVRFLFGCEAEMGCDNQLAIPKPRYNDFDFIIVATTHFHLMSGKKWDGVGKSALIDNWIARFDAVLNSDLPFGKVGIAHLATPHIFKKDRGIYLQILNEIPRSELELLFSKAAKLNLGIELNGSMLKFKDEEADVVLRMFKIAKNCGCKFYLGSDVHRLKDFDNVNAIFQKTIGLLNLTESDKFVII